MVSTNINFRTDESTKSEAEEIFSQLGISMSAALNMFLRQVIIRGGIPFEPTTRPYNAETMRAIEEGHQIALDDSRRRFDSTDELFEELRS